MSYIETISKLRPQYRPSDLDNIEYLELYRPGGFHPVSIGDIFDDGRYRVLHKLGFGGSSTVWLARDQLQQQDSSVLGTLVSLKFLSAEESSKQSDEILALSVSLKLNELLSTAHHPARRHVQVMKDFFMVKGPNGTHLCLVSPFAGPSILAMSFCPGRVAGSKRLRGNLARKVAKQTATVLEFMHSAGFVHGDLTLSNVLLQLSDQVFRWSDSEIYTFLGKPEVGRIRNRDGSSPGESAPRELVEPVDRVRFSSLPILQENIVVIDFGQTFVANSPPKGYEPTTVMHYASPETRFERRISAASDIWTLACAIFEIRSGYALFESFFGGDSVILRKTVEMLGRLPDPWWSAFECHDLWFEENGQPKPYEFQKGGPLSHATKTSIREQLRRIGKLDVIPEEDEGPMIEVAGTPLDEGEISLLGDLLEKMLKYRPEERITIQEVVEHPWFNYTFVK